MKIQKVLSETDLNFSDLSTNQRNSLYSVGLIYEIFRYVDIQSKVLKIWLLVMTVLILRILVYCIKFYFTKPAIYKYFPTVCI